MRADAFIVALLHSILACFRSRKAQAIVELALRQQLATYSQTQPKPRLAPVPSEKLVRPVVIEGFPDLGQAASRMIPALLAVLASFRSLFRSRAALQAEPSALRHQLLVLQRQHGGRRVPLRTSDRLLWAYLSRIWPGWRRALVLVQPDPRVAHRRELGEVTALPEVGGRHHRYERRAA